MFRENNSSKTCGKITWSTLLKWYFSNNLSAVCTKVLLHTSPNDAKSLYVSINTSTIETYLEPCQTSSEAVTQRCSVKKYS